MEENKMWEWLQTATKAISYNLISNRAEAEDVASDVMVELLKDRKYAERIYKHGQKETDKYKYGKCCVLVKLIQEQYAFHRIGRYFADNRKTALVYSVLYMQIQEICKTYNISPVPQNAYLIAYGTGIANVDIVEKILNTVIPQQIDIECAKQIKQKARNKEEYDIREVIMSNEGPV